MKSFIIILFFCNFAYAQSSFYAMDTIIHKDEYYEMAYQLIQCRIRIDSLEKEVRINEWRFTGYEHLLSAYRNELKKLEKQLRINNRKRNEKTISEN